MMRKARTHVAAMARKPRTTITAMAQCGKSELFAFDCTAPPVGELVLLPEAVGFPVTLASDAAETEDADATEAEDDALDARIESANVVSAGKVALK